MAKKSVLITGCAKRVGHDIALYMAENGWNVAIHYNKSEEEAQKLLKKVKSKGVEAVAIKAELADENQVRTLIAQAYSEIGALSCLINNASIFHNDSITNMETKSLDSHLGINLRAPVLLSQEFLFQLGKQKHGNIINMLDYCVWNLPDKFLSYSISKSALWAATQLLAKQMAPNVRVNGIGPGHTLPNEKESKESFQKARKKTPLQNGADTDEICRAIDFIINSPSMTGQMIALDGGKHLVGADFY